MASITITLDTRRANSEGNYPAKIVISNIQTIAHISLNLSIPEKAWIKNGLQRPIKASFPASKIYNDRIEGLYIELRQKMIKLEESGEIRTMKASEIKKRILESDNDFEEIRFSDFALSFSGEFKNQGTRRNYIHTVNKIITYTNSNSIRFEDINVQFLRKFDEWLSESGSGVNTRSIHFRNIRAIFNRAIDDEVINQSIYPFRKFKIRDEQRDKVSLTAGQVKTLYGYPFETPSLCMARDYWMLSFFLCGINPIDLYNLKKPDGEGRVSFIRSKMQSGTHNTVRLLFQPEALEIAGRYRNDDESEYLLKFIDKYISYDIFKSFISKKIRDIAKITGFDGLTMYHARYSWATIADSLDIPEKTISKGLGHVDKSMAGRKYIAFDWSKVDRANREVIDWVMK